MKDPKDYLYMWPSRHGLGVQLSYGLHGGSIYSEKLDPEHPWKFARARDGGLALSKIHNSTQRLVRPQISNVDISVTKNDKLNDVLQDIPHALLEQLKDKEEFMSSEFIYDPTYGKVIDNGLLRAYRSDKYHDGVVFVSGPARSTLCVHLLSTNERTVEDEDDQSVEDEEGHSFEIRVPVLGKGCNWEFSSPIKQVEFCKPVQIGSKQTTSIVVRTALSINIMRVEIKKDSINLSHFAEIHPNLLFGISFSCVSSNPFSGVEFAAVDEAGNWGIFKISRAGNPSRLQSGKIFDSEDFSSFKRISWGINESNIIVLSRSYVKTFNRYTMDKSDIISAKKWSFIRDYKRWQNDDRFAFLLTSRELIWIDVSQGFKRILVWKHYLDADDPSLSLQVSSIGEITFVAIHSQVHPLVFISQFQFQDGLPQSIRDPIMIKTDTSTIALDFLLIPMSISKVDGVNVNHHAIALFKISTQLEVTRMVISTLKSARLIKYSAQRRNSILRQKKESVMDKKSASLNRQKETVVKSLADEIYGPPLETQVEIEQDDSEIFQNYALSLGLDENQEKPPSSLLKSAAPLENFNDFEEFDNMMEQLEAFCESKKLAFIPLKKMSYHVCGDSYSKIKDLYLHLYKLWNKNSNSDYNKFFAKHVTKDLALSLSITYDNSLETSQFLKKVVKLPKSLKGIVDKWDDGFEQEDQVEQIPRQLVEETSTPQPIVTVSQSQSRASSTAQGLLIPSQKFASQSQMPSQSIKSSQNISSQQRPKKKKRRITGFG